MAKLIFLLLFVISVVSYANPTSNTFKLTNDTVVAKTTSDENNRQKDSLISLLSIMQSDTLDCTADAYWKIIKRGKASIPLLIESLTDTTLTNIYNHCKHGKLNVGEISYFALHEIVELPEFAVTHIQFDTDDEDGCWSFFDYLFDSKNKKAYQKMVRDFYNSQHFVLKKYSKKELMDCYKQYKIDGKLKWVE